MRHPANITFVGLLALASVCLLPAPGAAQPLGGTWRPIGASPNTRGQVENVIPDNEVIGAVHTVVAHPTNPDILWIGAVNGGIWRSDNATASSPDWSNQTDGQPSLSIGALERDPTDPTNQSLLAGIGSFSSFSGVGGRRTGLLRTTDGGASWTPVDGGGALVDKNISGVAPRGATMVVAVNLATPFTFPNVGIFRSTDGGASFTQISTGNGAATGLPGGLAFDLASDPADPARLFTSIIFADLVGGANGIYRSTDTGATWTKVSSPAMDALILNDPTRGNIEIAVGRANNVFVAIANGGRLAGVFRSGDGGTTWTAMDVPAIHPGGQAGTHLSIAADPTDPSIVYLGGDRQDRPGDLNAADFSGRLFRGDASRPRGSQLAHLTHSRFVGAAGGGTLSASAPHADSREMVFDAQGDLIETDDGGIYRRTQPRSNQGDWLSLNGSLQVAELHDVAWDSVTDLAVGGAQDTGSSFQSLGGDIRWLSISTGDGGDVAVDDTSTPGRSVRYSSFQSLRAFRRQVFNANNTLLSQVFPPLFLLGGGAQPAPSFVNPIELNAVAPQRLIIGASNGVYESFDQGDTIRQISTSPVNGFGADPIAYGAAGNADALYIGSGDTVRVRIAPPPAPLALAAAYPGTGTGRPVADIALDPGDPRHAFVIDGERVYRTQDAGATWAEVTGDLPGLDPGQLRALAYLPRVAGGGAGVEAVALGTSGGVFVALGTGGFATWQRLGQGFPNVATFDLDYDATDDVLVAGTLGRGAWLLSPTALGAQCLYETDFEAAAVGSDGGWTNAPESTCTTGAFVVGTPDEVINGGVRTQVAGDATTGTGRALFTQPNTNGPGTDDVDGGRCIALSPQVQTSGPVTITAAVFHGQRDTGDDPNDGQGGGDGFALEVIDASGTVLATLATNGDTTANADWTRVTATIPGPATLRLRLQAADGPGPGDLVEAGIDDVRICPGG